MPPRPFPFSMVTHSTLADALRPKVLVVVRLLDVAALGLLCWGSVLLSDGHMDAAMRADVAGLLLYAALARVERRLERAP
ncbi:hypothetical protein [Corallococcus sp. AS-1-6]|uniref:hypothetical protein n=1 Tax=Corallococcus sp. AS-1-6 TaxID=2874599 RepID=UPI001CBEF6C0|nr:hypothetical protein [Corallococcus sp. AS-1-6]MBZ4371468.1 hypothetical protein [Corallococcus sp. AS-1-6]